MPRSVIQPLARGSWSYFRADGGSGRRGRTRKQESPRAAGFTGDGLSLFAYLALTFLLSLL
jgi:hypothetical protein